MKLIRAFLSLLLCLLAAPLVQAQQGGFLKVADMVNIELKTPAEDAQNVTSKYVVSDTGTIKMPMLRQEIAAVGLTPTSLARKIEAAYRSEEIYTNPTINAFLPQEEGVANHVVVVSGEVKVTGEFAVRQNMRLMTAISKAGGFTDFAKTKAVRLLRGNKSTVYDMRKIQEDGSNNPILLDGDSIIVPSG